MGPEFRKKRSPRIVSQRTVGGGSMLLRFFPPAGECLGRGGPGVETGDNYRQ